MFRVEAGLAVSVFLALLHGFLRACYGRGVSLLQYLACLHALRRRTVGFGIAKGSWLSIKPGFGVARIRSFGRC